jgi:hypothetical protein
VDRHHQLHRYVHALLSVGAGLVFTGRRHEIRELIQSLSGLAVPFVAPYVFEFSAIPKERHPPPVREVRKGAAVLLSQW